MTRTTGARRATLAASAGLLALGVAMPAAAQDTQLAAADTDQNEIIVTAQRRTQTLLEVPQSVSVVGGETLERQQATSFLDYAQLVPGLSITQDNPGESRVILRGINTGSVASTVSIYVDDVPFGSSGSLSNAGELAGDFDTFDVARIEVLRGPQGTLYGANSLGGTLKFVTAAPAFDRFEARGQAGVEFVDDGGTGWSGNALVNLPVTDMLAIRASGFYRRNAGYVDTVGRSGEDVNRSDSYGGRVSVLFEPTDNFSVRLFAMAQNIRTDSPSTYEVDPATLEPVNALTGLASDERTRFERIAEFNDFDYRLYSGTLDWDLGFATLTSVTSYATLDQRSITDFSNTAERDLVNAFVAPTAPGTVGLAFQADIDTDKFTQEVRLASPDSGTIEWLVGAYYTRENALLFQRFQPFDLATQALLPTEVTLAPGVTVPEIVFVTLDSNYEEVAGFASATWHISPRFEVTAGGRYSHNSQDSVQFTSIFGGDETITGDSSESVFTWSVAPRFEINERTSLYARVAKGYRPGGPNAVPPGAPADFPATFRADTLVSYEIGLRGETEDRTFAFDASLFYLDWKNILINTVFIDPDTGTAFGTNGNGRRARSLGAEATATLRPMRGLTAVLNLAYTDAELRDDTTPEDGALNLVGGLRGDKLPYTPEFSMSLSTDYEWTLSGSTRAFVGGNVRLVSDQTGGFDPDYRAVFGRRPELDGYTTVDLRAGVDFEHFSVTAYVRNLTNSRGLVSTSGYPRQIPPVVGGNDVPLAFASSIRPRTIGFTLGARF
ncbi:TonB-dependent receptor [Sphingosinicella sp. LHD-64]|uniref:TonB-dependent receptor n=1 Tax=Sphingosinicella sp. LHD-64 TaxID=3072139 RepID=UPI00280D4B56|nr:TonB-dependent receptor [Sphingosinicella sp. LHD-64]MDQ8756604.1 TonB-dependent receptor [Sphingosinicella sp. LHD-64]